MTLTFLVSDDARIFIYGREARLTELRAGMRANVHAAEAVTAGNVSQSGTRPRETATGSRAVRLLADRIEVLPTTRVPGSTVPESERR